MVLILRFQHSFLLVFFYNFYNVVKSIYIQIQDLPSILCPAGLKFRRMQEKIK